MGTNKALGQHWLKNRAILEEIAELAKSEVRTCVEIGPGLGTLTSSLLKRFDRVIAVEYDARLAENLPKSFPGKNLEVVNEDILQFDFGRITEPYVVAGNIPYYITSPIIEKLLKLENLPERIVLLIQKEVAERIADKKETQLSLLVKNRAEIELGPVVKRAEFTPPPKVDSQVIVLMPHAPVVDDEVFRLVKIGFRAPRKKLVHNLATIKPKPEVEQILRELGISPDARPGDLGLKEWGRLYDISKTCKKCEF
ncbi:ribosomal RNA small subunit methyltransferase A [Candidatus Saccharibacteria bacterium]|nr:ribosomal RNA small subunit methyltransferase A [Candidatus Saccharibacteria bacterium]